MSKRYKKYDKVKYNDSTYALLPEKLHSSCFRCDLYDQRCPVELTKYCLQGFILKEIQHGR